MDIAKHSGWCLIIAAIEIILAIIFGIIIFTVLENFRLISIILVFILGISGLFKLIIKAIPSSR